MFTENVFREKKVQNSSFETICIYAILESRKKINLKIQTQADESNLKGNTISFQTHAAKLLSVCMVGWCGTHWIGREGMCEMG